MEIREVEIARVLTRTGGYLEGIASHSLQPYRGCAYGRSLCGVGCYVQHNPWVTQGRRWGDFLEVRVNAAASYLAQAGRERAWAARRGIPFGVFMASSTDPFVPQETRAGVTRAVLAAMLEAPPEVLIVQTHTARVLEALAGLEALRTRTRLRVHLSIETDRERFPGLPGHASPVAARLSAAARLRQAGIPVWITVAPLLPIQDPERFFARVAEVADAVVLDHFVGGDGTPDGRRTRGTGLPSAMEAVEPGSTGLAYRDRMAAVAARFLPGRVGLGAAGFAGRFSLAV